MTFLPYLMESEWVYVLMKWHSKMYFWNKIHMHLSVESDPRELLSYETSMQRELRPV